MELFVPNDDSEWSLIDDNYSTYDEKNYTLKWK